MLVLFIRQSIWKRQTQFRKGHPTFLFILVFAWNEYLLALFLSGAKSQTMPLTVAAQNATRGPQWWYMSVLILIMITPVVLIAIGLERYIARGLLVGAVKG
jgi:multiple sugar transport system permease protein